jgi:tRNA G18 (ribose-2'-O)-methylase SpoU
MLHYNKKRKLLEKRYRKSMSTDKHRLIPITDLHTPELEIYNERREVQLFHYYEPERGLFIAESPNVILRALAAGYEPLSLLMEQREADSEKGREILGRIAEVSGEIPVYVASNEVLSEISGFKLARGMLCAMRRRALPKMEDLCGNARRIAVLENVVNHKCRRNFPFCGSVGNRCSIVDGRLQ